MAVLTACWVIIETVIIPDGLRKWICLSYFVHPSILVLCQVFLWLKLFIECLVVVLFFPFRVAYGLCLYIFGPLRKCVILLYSFVRLKKSSQAQEEVEQYFEAQQAFEFDRISYSNVLPSAASIRSKVTLLEFKEYSLDYLIDCEEEEEEEEEEENVDENEDSFHGSSSDDVEDSIPYKHEENFTEDYFLRGSKSFVAEDYPSAKIVPLSFSESPGRDDQYSSAAYSSNFQLVEADEEPDGFYAAYAKRMRWFDVLNYDRTCGISAIEKKQIGTPSPLKSIEYSDSGSGVVRISWSKTATRRLLESFENDFEMVYVAQACLSWQALFHQYTKVKALQNSSSHNTIFCSYVAGEFQKFQILLERFMENEQSEGKRVWNYVRERFSLKGLLQVPEVSVKRLLKEDEGNMKDEGTNIKGLLKLIEQCIESFWLFVKTDNSKRSWWKIKTSSWTYPPVEDPRDLELLADLTKRLQKNKLWLKDLEGKKRCLLKRIVNHLEDSQRKELLFTMIDMKLVSRVLQISMISSPQLKWCKEILESVEFKDGKVFRASTHPLFPH